MQSRDLSAAVLIPGAVTPMRAADMSLRNTGQVRRVVRRVRNTQVFPYGSLRSALKSAVMQESSGNNALLILRDKTVVSCGISSSSKRE